MAKKAKKNAARKFGKEFAAIAEKVLVGLPKDEQEEAVRRFEKAIYPHARPHSTSSSPKSSQDYQVSARARR